MEGSPKRTGGGFAGWLSRRPGGRDAGSTKPREPDPPEGWPSKLPFRKRPKPYYRAIRWTPVRGRPDARFHPRDDESTRPYELFVAQSVLRDVRQHLITASSGEPFGFLLGQVVYCPWSETPYILIDALRRETQPLPSSSEIDRFRHAWVGANRDARHRRAQLIGWYHRHGVLGLQMSEWDLKLQEEFFPDPWQCSLIIAASHGPTGGFIQRSHRARLFRKGLASFQELIDVDAKAIDGRRVSLVDWKNYRTDQPVHVVRADWPRPARDVQPIAHKPRSGGAASKIPPLTGEAGRKDASVIELRPRRKGVGPDPGSKHAERVEAPESAAPAEDVEETPAGVEADAGALPAEGALPEEGAPPEVAEDAAEEQRAGTEGDVAEEVPDEAEEAAEAEGDATEPEQETAEPDPTPRFETEPGEPPVAAPARGSTTVPPARPEPCEPSYPAHGWLTTLEDERLAARARAAEIAEAAAPDAEPEAPDDEPEAPDAEAVAAEAEPPTGESEREPAQSGTAVSHPTAAAPGDPRAATFDAEPASVRPAPEPLPPESIPVVLMDEERWQPPPILVRIAAAALLLIGAGLGFGLWVGDDPPPLPEPTTDGESGPDQPAEFVRRASAFRSDLQDFRARYLELEGGRATCEELARDFAVLARSHARLDSYASAVPRLANELSRPRSEFGGATRRFESTGCPPPEALGDADGAALEPTPEGPGGAEPPEGSGAGPPPAR